LEEERVLMSMKWRVVEEKKKKDSSLEESSMLNLK